MESPLVPGRSLDIGKSLTYMFEEDGWVNKFVIAVVMTLLSIFIIPGIILQGYVIEIIRRKRDNTVPLLPEWDDWGKYLKDGFNVVIASLVYALPIIIAAGVYLCAAIVRSDSNTGEMSGAAALIGFCFSCVTILYVIPMIVFITAGIAEYAQTGQLSSFFNFRNFSVLKSGSDGNPRKSFVIALVVSVLASMVAGFIPFVGQTWYMLVQGHLMGQVLKMTDSGERPVNSGPSVINTI